MGPVAGLVLRVAIAVAGVAATATLLGGGAYLLAGLAFALTLGGLATGAVLALLPPLEDYAASSHHPASALSQRPSRVPSHSGPVASSGMRK